MKKFAIICISVIACLMISNLIQMKPTLGAEMPSPSWRTKANMTTTRGQAVTIAGDNGLIYVMGGFGGSDPPMKTAEAYDPVTDRWITKANLLVATRWACGTKGLDGAIYVISGEGGSGKIDDLQVYNATSNTWASKASIPVPAWAASAVAGNDGRIYVFGGESPEASSSNITQIYDPAIDEWINGTALPTGRKQSCAVRSSDGLIYVIGGYNDSVALATVEAYNPVLDSWITKSSMPSAKLGFAAVLGPDNKIYVIGGGNSYFNDAPPYFDTVEVYDPKTDSWSIPTWSESLMPTARRELGAALASNGMIYAIGGANGGYLNTNEEALIVLPDNIAPSAYIDSVMPNPSVVGDYVVFTGHGLDQDGSVVAYKWRSSINGTIGNAASLNITGLAKGTHNIYFSVQDNSGAWSTEAMAVVNVNGLVTDDPLYQQVQNLNGAVSTLQDQNANLMSSNSALSQKLDTMTLELLGASAVIIILVIIIVAVMFLPPKRKTTPT